MVRWTDRLSPWRLNMTRGTKKRMETVSRMPKLTVRAKQMGNIYCTPI